MSVVEEIREEQKKALSTMNFKEKIVYFWDYYKIHTMVAIVVLAMAITFIHQYITNKDYGFYAAFVNASLTESNYELATSWAEEFQEFAQIDPNEYVVYIDTSISLSDDTGSQYAVSNQEKMLALLQVGAVSTIVADTATFEKYAQNEYFYDLEALLSSEELEKYGAYLYYTDASTFDDGSDDTFRDESERTNPADLTVNHRDPSAMEQPVAVGLILSEDNKLADAGYYTYLSDDAYIYQGYPADVVLGIPITNQDPQWVIRFLEYIRLGQ